MSLKIFTIDVIMRSEKEHGKIERKIVANRCDQSNHYLCSRVACQIVMYILILPHKTKSPFKHRKVQMTLSLDYCNICTLLLTTFCKIKKNEKYDEVLKM